MGDLDLPDQPAIYESTTSPEHFRDLARQCGVCEDDRFLMHLCGYQTISDFFFSIGDAIGRRAG